MRDRWLVRPKILVIKGDGIGPEVIGASLQVLEELGFDAEWLFREAGYEYYVRTGKPYQDDLLDVAAEVDVIYKGPIETPKAGGFRSVTVTLRRELDLYANIRPFKSYPRVALNPDVDVVIVRENTEGLYIQAETMLGKGQAIALRLATRRAAERIARKAFELAIELGKKRVTLVHKANILKVSDGIYLEEFYKVAQLYKGVIEADDVIVDAAGYFLVRNPSRFQVIVTANLYGDILSDVAAGVAGTMGLFGSANVGDEKAMFEPVHGTAQDIAGKGIANPTAALSAAIMMLRWLSARGYGQKLSVMADVLEKAIYDVIREGKVLTPDLGGNAKTIEFAEQVAKKALEYMGD